MTRVRALARAKEGEDAKLWGLGCVNPFVSRRISFHGVSTGLHRFIRRGNSSGTTVVLYDSSTYFSRGSYVPSFGRSTDSTAIRNRNDRRERSSTRLESCRRPLGNDPTTDLFRFLRNDTELDRNLSFSGLLSFPLLPSLFGPSATRSLHLSFEPIATRLHPIHRSMLRDGLT